MHTLASSLDDQETCFLQLGDRACNGGSSKAGLFDEPVIGWIDLAFAETAELAEQLEDGRCRLGQAGRQY